MCQVVLAPMRWTSSVSPAEAITKIPVIDSNSIKKKVVLSRKADISGWSTDVPIKLGHPRILSIVQNVISRFLGSNINHKENVTTDT